MQISTCIALFLAAAVSVAWASCPAGCRCVDDKLSCANSQLAHLPSLEDSKWVRSIDLRHNVLRRLPTALLSHTPFVHTIFAGHNQIRQLPQNLLDDLPALRRLYLSRNDISYLPPLTTVQTSPLRVVDIHGNRLSKVDRHAFEGLFDLESVNLAHNSLQTLPGDVFADSRRIKTLQIGHNPWNCDCRLAEFIVFLRDNRDAEKGVSAKCAHPAHLHGRSLVDLTPEQLVCPPAIAAVTDDGYELSCPTSGAVTGVEWLIDGVPKEMSAYGEYARIGGVNGSTLLIPVDVDPTKFTCAVDYVVSPLRQSRQLPAARRPGPPSQPSQPSVEGPPRFTYTPRDRSYREGSAVKLNCEVVGSPRPAIDWFFNGVRIVASRTREFKNDNTQLVVYPFLERDVGTYTCTAFNRLGEASSSAKLALILSSSPTIYDPPRSRKARPGDFVVLRCGARGEPKPQISWQFNGNIIPFLRGHFSVSDDGTELTITHVTRQDEGTFTCSAGNSVGIMSAEAELTVESDGFNNLDSKLDDATLRSIVKQASSNVEQAIQKTQADLKTGITSPHDLLRHFKFVSRKPVELTRAREVYEESLRLVQKHVQQGLRMDPSRLPSNLSFESVLAVSHVQTIMELSGCMNGQFKDACSNMCYHSKYRSYDGQCNNFEHPMWGVSQIAFRRLLPPVYENGFNTPVGWNPDKLYYGFRKPNPRVVSLQLIGTHDITPHDRFSSMLMQWGQFIDHDMDFTATALSRQTYATGAICNKTCENVDPCFNIPLPRDDPKRIHLEKGKYPCIEFERSAAICGSGETAPIFHQVTYREQVNIITSYIDASNVYGSTEVDALDLRDLFSDHGLLRFDIVSTSQKPYMPFEKDSAMDCRRNRSVDNPIRCFLGGDFRANEQLGLTAMHTLWMREHNRIASRFLEMNPDWDGERIYQEARKLVGALMQHITYKHWLPLVLGTEGFARWIGSYGGYNSEVEPSISNEFATAAFRFGHTVINPKLARLGKDFESIAVGPISLGDAFFAPERMLSEGGIDPLLRGLFATPLKRPMSSQLLNKELTEKLFSRGHEVALDLAVMNIQRGRDHGIPGYLEYRRFCNLSVPETWADLRLDLHDASILAKLQQIYGHPGNMDLWVGGVLERRLPDALVGPTFSCIIGEQFKRLRDGDRFWYERPGVFTDLQLQQIRKGTLARVLCDNGDEIDRVQPDVFLHPGPDKKGYKSCQKIPEVALKMWMSCCDETCSASSAGGSSASRRRRSHFVDQSAPYKTPHKAPGCVTDDGIVHSHGQIWSQGSCQKCKCLAGKTWCSVDEICQRLH